MNLLGGPFTGLIPVASSYTTLLLWCLGAVGCGVLFVACRFGNWIRKSVLWSLVLFLLALGQIALVVMTVNQLSQTFQLQSKASVGPLIVSPGSYTDKGPLLLFVGLGLLVLSSLIGLVRQLR
jgi:hypothetical protein